MIHKTAQVSADAVLGENVEVGPFAIVEGEVKIGPGTVIGAHSMISRYTTIGSSCYIYPYASIGTPPQDVGFVEAPTRLEIGDNTTIREFVTINRGTEKGGGVTRVGKDNYIMSYCHIAHDCLLGEGVVMVNAASLSGHVEVGDFAVLSAYAGVIQFVRIGASAFLGARAGLDKDVPPFSMATGYRARIYGLNLVGLRRRGFPRDVIKTLKEVYRILFRSEMLLDDAVKRVEEEFGDLAQVRELLDFIKSSKKGIAAGNNREGYWEK
jgi:UDP-N-acetylglucosamine acyltransferase